MSKICGIYKITSPSNRIYIGQSVAINSRFSYYKGMKCKGQRKLYNSFKKHGFKNHKFEVIEECLPEQLNEREIYYIRLFDCFNTKHGLNLKDGGSGGSLSEETKEKLRQINLGKPQSKESRDKKSKALLGHFVAEETKEKIRKANTGYKWSSEAIAKRTETRRKNGWNKRHRK